MSIADASMDEGYYAFLFTDLEGSSRLWERGSASFERMRDLISQHYEQLTQICESNGGKVYKYTGDGIHVRFSFVNAAIQSATAIILALATDPSLRVRVAIHFGYAILLDRDYYGMSINRLARILGAGHGGQILLSQASVSHIDRPLTDGVTFRVLGEYRLRDLQDSEFIYQLIIPGVQNEFPPLNTLDAHPHNLPLQPILFGRGEEIARLVKILADETAQLLTLTGTGGIGKTRLALQVAAEASELFTNGVFFIPLDVEAQRHESVDDRAIVLSRIAQTLGIKDVNDLAILNTVADWLRHKKVLLILDTFEHLISEVEDVIDLIRACPRLKVMVTSRRVLREYGEVPWQVGPLPIPDSDGRIQDVSMLLQNPAVALFVDRARNVSSARFELNQETGSLVVDICKLLDGLPLAIELAASRLSLGSSSLGDLAEDLAQHLLPTLNDGLMRLQPRLRTMRSTIDWSYQLLTEPEQVLFRRLSVFPGTFTASAIREICFGEVDNLGQTARILIDSEIHNNLIQRAFLHEDARETARYRMLTTIREFSLELLQSSGEIDDLEAQHATYFLSLVEKLETEMFGQDEETTLSRLDKEYDNIRAALQWTWKQNRFDMGLRFAGSLARYWQRRGRIREGRDWLDKFMGAPSISDVASGIRAKAFNGLGVLARLQGDYTRAEQALGQALGLFLDATNNQGLAFCYLHLGNLERERGNIGEASHLYRCSLGEWETMADGEWGIAAVLNNLGAVEQDNGELIEAESRYFASIEHWKKLGKKRDEAVTYFNLAALALTRGELRQAQEWLKQGSEMSRRLNDRHGIARSLEIEGELARTRMQFKKAHEAFEEFRKHIVDLGDQRGVAISYLHMGSLARDRRRLGEAEENYRTSFEVSRKLRDVAGCANADLGLANILVDTTEYSDAFDLYKDSLSRFQDIGKKLQSLSCIEGIAALAVHLERYFDAGELISSVDAERAAANIKLVGLERSRHDRIIQEITQVLGNSPIQTTVQMQTLSYHEAVRKALDMAW